MTMRKPSILAGACLAALLAGCAPQATRPEPVAGEWPSFHGAAARDADIERRVAQILAGMDLRQKVGQMTQPEIKSITPAQVREHYIGSVLNGGGSWPAKNKHATVGDWLALADAYYDASMATGLPIPVPVMWGTDAVHGHSNVYGATVFPHNIGLGATRDPELVHDIGAATARAVRATGIDWAFSPALPVVQNVRWGRSYESFSEDGGLVRTYAEAYTRGMQGKLGEGSAIATAKHFIGDGGTENGKDQGHMVASKRTVVDVHGQGYYGAMDAGVLTVMASYNSWTDPDSGIEYGKMHGSRELLTGALKEKMGFDGFIVSDWNAIGQLPGCSNASCAAAINAGIDMIMVPDDWKAFIDNTVAQVERGEIPMSRIDDAVSRILRVKLRAGLFDGRKPSAHRDAGSLDAVQDRALARRAVRESLVLLKNDGGVLPLPRGGRVLVVGKNADSIANQSGGWTLTWQGTDNSNADFPNGDAILAGIRETVGQGGEVVFSETAQGIDVSAFDRVIAVIGETPYAEYAGDLVPSTPLSHSTRHPEDLAVLKAVSGKGKPVVTVFLSGRPAYANDLLNLSDAFVAAWLPGTEGKGVADVLFRDAKGGIAHDITGRLPFSWPGHACPGPRGGAGSENPPLFAFGYGLDYAGTRDIGSLPVDIPAQGCGDATTLGIFKLRDEPPFALHLAAGGQERKLGADLNSTIEWPEGAPALRVGTVQINTQQDAKQVSWLKPAAFLARGQGGSNLNPMRIADAALQFDTLVSAAPKSAVMLSMQCGTACGGGIDLRATFSAMPIGRKQTVIVPLACFAKRGVDMGGIDVPFRIDADKPFSAAFTSIQVVAGAGKHANAVACDP